MVASLCQEHSNDAGEIIFLEGANSDELYTIMGGEADILVNPSLASPQPNDQHAPVTTIATLRRGQSFGEIALVDQGLRSATA